METKEYSMMMNDSDIDIVQKMAKDSEENDTYEFEVVLENVQETSKNSWSRDDFTRVLDLCRKESCSSGKFKCIKERDKTLDITVGEYRITIFGKYYIELYIQNKEVLNSLPQESFTIIKKERVRSHNPKNGYRLNLKNEIPVDYYDPEFANALVEWERLAKTFRMKNRYSYLVDDIYSIDLTVVKAWLNGSQLIRTRTLLESKTLEASEIYEVEIEYMPDVEKYSKTFDIKIWSQLVYKLICTLQNCWKLVKTEKLEDIKLNYYLTLDPSSKYLENVKKQKIDWILKKYGMSPQVVSLDMERLRVLREMTDNDYTITMKSDGVRMIGFVSKNQENQAELYLAGSKSTKFMATGCIFDNNIEGTIFDGELITKDKHGNTVVDYLVFDCYYFMGTDIRKNNLLTGQNTRLSKAQEALDEIIEIQSLNDGIQVKTFVKEFEVITKENFKEKCKDWLDKIEESPYENDGLIFTPEEAVGGANLYPDNSTSFVKSSGTFERLLKWKDISFNSIDFKVNIGETVKKLNDENELINFSRCVLNVTYSNSWKPTTEFTRNDYLKDQESFLVKNDKSSVLEFMPYTPPDETACFVDFPKINNELRCKTETGWDGPMFKNGDIVEMVYNMNESVKWTPIRIRRDKEMPNHFNTASNIWRSYFNPVTKEILTGKMDIPDKNIEEDIYYNLINVSNRNQTRRESGLRLFHCHIKGLLLEKVFKDFDKDNKSLIDLCSGKGGDLNRYIDFGASKVLGIDNSVDNLHNPIDGAYRRLWKLNLSNKNRVKFLAADVGKPLTSTKTFYPPYDKSPELSIFKQGNPEFNACTVFFALHYFFEKKNTISTFLDNVAANINKGGYFAGCCYDGSNIFNQLKNKSYINFKVQNTEILRIEKKYKESANLEPNETSLGHKIRVLVQSIGTEHDEYLVNFEYLKIELMRRGFVEVHSKNFENFYLENTNNRFKMETEEQQASFLNRTFVFRKENKFSGESVVIKDKLKLKI